MLIIGSLFEMGLVDFFCLCTSENSTGQTETPSAWLTQMAAIAASSSPTRKALLVSGELEILL